MTTHPLTPLQICYIVGAIVTITLMLETAVYCAARVLDVYEDTAKGSDKTELNSDGESQSQTNRTQVVLSILRILTFPYSCSLCRHLELSGTQSRNGNIWRRVLQLAGLHRVGSDRPSWVSHSKMRHDYFSETKLATRRYSLHGGSNTNSLDIITDLSMNTIKSTNLNPVNLMTRIKAREDPASAEVEDRHQSPPSLQSIFEQLVDNYPECLYVSHTQSSTTNHARPATELEAIALCSKKTINGKTEYLGPIALQMSLRRLHSRRLWVRLSEADAEFVVERGWGGRCCDHAYDAIFCAEQEMDGAKGELIEVMLPRDEKDVAVLLEIVKVSIWFTVSMLRYGDGLCCGRGDEENCGYGYGYGYGYWYESGCRSEDEKRGGKGEKMSMAMAAW